MPPVRMTRSEYEATYGVKPVVSSSTLDTTPAPIQMTRAEYDAKYRPKPQTALQDFKTDILETGQAVKDTFTQGADKFGEIDARVASGETSQAKGLFQKFGRGLSTVSNAIFQTGIGIAKANLPQSVETRIAERYGPVLQELASPEVRSSFIERLKQSEGGLLVGADLDKKAGAFFEDVGKAYQTDPNFQADVQAAGGILEWLSLPGTARTALLKTADVVSEAGDIVEDVAILARQKADSFKVSRNDSNVQKVASEIEAIENKYAPTRRKADADPVVGESRTRIAQSNVLENAIDEDGLIRTKTKGGAVDAYRAQTIDGVEDVVRKNLEVEGKKVNLNEVRADMYDAVTNSGLEGGDLTRAIKGIDAELKGLSLRADEFGDVLLAKIQDAKTSIYKHIDWTKPSGVTYRKSLARVYKELIENKSSLPVKKWNGELAKFYKDLDRIADLDGKRAKGGRLGKYTANIAGSAVGGVAGATAGAPGALVGGMLGGEIAGFIQGKSMARTFRSGIKGDIPENKILADAKARAEAGTTKDLTKPDPQVGAPKALVAEMPDAVKKEVSKVEGQIKTNIKQQNAAIKAGDFALVEALKDVYKVLVARLKEIIADYRKNGIQPGLSIKKSVTPESVAKKADAEDMKLLASVIDDVKNARLDPDTNRILSNMGLGRATDEELVAFAKEVFDEKDGVANRVVQRKNEDKNALMSDQNQAISAPTNAQTISRNIDPSASNVKKSVGTADPTLRTKREVSAKTMSGEKFTVPSGTVLKPMVDGAKVTIEVGGKTYTIPKNQYQNLVGQSDVAKASPFAPELADTVETVKGAKTGDSKAKAMETITSKGYTLEEDMMDVYIAKNGEPVEYDDLPKDVRKALDTYIGDAEIRTDIEPGQTPKYSQYTLDGGENYREILIQAPETLKKGEYGTDVIDKSQTYRSSHWSEPNVISHLRMNERTVDGKKYAFMEELQSDWAREGRDKGFIDEAATKFTSLPTGYVVKTRKIPEGVGVINGGKDRYWVESPNGERVSGVANNGEHWDKQDAIDTALRGFNKYGAVPNNPLLKNWQIPTTKRALIEAVDSGADRFAWINGEQTSARYNLATQVDTVKWETGKDGWEGKKQIYVNAKSGRDIIIKVGDNGEVLNGKSVPTEWVGKKLDEVLGKGLADKIMEKPDGTLSGEGLSFGGEWAKNLYDRQVRDIVKKLTGAEVKTVDMGLGTGNKDTTFYPVGKRTKLTKDDLFVGDNIETGDGKEYVITDVLGNGKFKAITDRDLETFGSIENAPDADKYDFDLSTGSQTQQYIDLTPEVKAKIQSKAPSFKMKTPSVADGIPLLLLMFGATYAPQASE